ncbi:hypothetical protein H5410_010761 [Solanum commersonii]|uniref:GATA-type domain-containing protein n=1 Tax=Solanum commersonii TaxID=4109 RepID=A0A9J6ANB3_SOLCO|nr:hypothetical protein H5410_010761 [Solanum commersonii]
MGQDNRLHQRSNKRGVGGLAGLPKEARKVGGGMKRSKNNESQEETAHWRPGPAEKPVLCNACGSRWRIRGTLHNYVPRHAIRETQSYQLPSETTTRLLVRDGLEVGVSGQEGSSACPGEELNNIPSLVDHPWSTACRWKKQMRSELTQRILSPVERLQRKLYNNLQEPEFENIQDSGEDVTLIYARNKYIPPNEIGLGAMLLVSPTTTTECSTSLPLMAEDNASCSMNVPAKNPYR